MLPAMDVINKLYHTVSNTVNQISNALPGNAVTKEYEVFEHIASAGPGLLWKVYSGAKKSTKQEASVLVFEKKNLEKYSKEDRDLILDILKRSVVQLTKIRHPRVLTVQHPLEESRDSIAFATEPVFASLSNVLGDHHNVAGNAAQALTKFELHPVEIKCGLLQLAEALAFLHNDAKILHRNICPDAVVINKEGSWKVFGFDYCATNAANAGAEPSWPFRPFNPTYHVLTQPSLDYMSPEQIVQSSHSPASDLYSLGILIYTLFSVNHKPIKMFGRNVDQYKRFAQDLASGRYPNLSCIPNHLSDYVRLLLNANPKLRPSIYDLSKISYFDDVAVKTLNYLDTSFQWNNLQKSKFYKGLPTILAEMPHRINLQHILPCLVREFVNPQMIPFVLPNFFLIAEKCTADEYRALHTHLKPVLRLQEPIQILLILVQNIALLLRQTPSEDLQSDVLPMLYRALETDTQQIQEMCLSILPALAANVDYSTIKNGILPRIRTLANSSQNVKIVVNCLVCIGRLLEHTDKWLVLDDIVPFLIKIKTRDSAVIMAILGVLKLIVNSSKLGVTKEIMATRIIPFLMPLSIENNLSVAQFDAILAMIKEMVHQVESEHRTKLEQLNSMQHVNKLPAFDDATSTATIPPLPFQTTPIVPQPIDNQTKSTAWDTDFVSASSKSVPSKSTSNRSIKSPATSMDHAWNSLNASAKSVPSKPTSNPSINQQPSTITFKATTEPGWNGLKQTRPDPYSSPFNPPTAQRQPTTAPVNPAWAISSPPPSRDPFADLHIEKKSLLKSQTPLAMNQMANATNRTEGLMLMQPTVNAPLSKRSAASNGNLSAQDIHDFLN